LRACDVGPGDEVVTVSHSFIATTLAISYVGASPVLVDIEPGTYTLDVSRLPDCITARTRAIIPVHLYGQVADMEPICNLARNESLRHRGRLPGAALVAGRPAGAIDRLFQLLSGKNLGTGEQRCRGHAQRELASRLVVAELQADQKVLSAFAATTAGSTSCRPRSSMAEASTWNSEERGIAALRFLARAGGRAAASPGRAASTTSTSFLPAATSSAVARRPRVGTDPLPDRFTTEAYADLRTPSGSLPSGNRRGSAVTADQPEMTDAQVDPSSTASFVRRDP
jgi:hypothetical protein